MSLFKASLLIIAALAVLPGCGSGHAIPNLVNYRLQKICSSPKALNINNDMNKTLSKLADEPTRVVRTILVSDSADPITTNSSNPILYAELPAENTAAMLGQAKATQANTPDLMHVTMHCDTLTATYYGPGVNSPDGVTGVIRQPKWKDNVGDLTPTDLYITGGEDEIPDPSTGKPVLVKVDIHIKKIVPDHTDATVGQKPWYKAKVLAEVDGVRKYKITITRHMPGNQTRKLVIMQTVNHQSNTTVNVDANVLAVYLAQLPPAYIQKMMASHNPVTLKLGGVASSGKAGILAYMKREGKAKQPVNIDILENARSSLAADYAAAEKAAAAAAQQKSAPAKNATK